MRISTPTIHARGASSIGDAQARMTKIQEQLSSGRRITTPQDDPIAAATAMRVSDTIARNDQFLDNLGAAKGALSYVESVTSDIGGVLQNVRERLVQAGNVGALTSSDRRTLAQDLRAQFTELLSLANSRDSAGNYLFSGGLERQQPFADGPSGVTYLGDQNERTLQVSSARTLAVGENGAELFQRVRTGNGVFATAAGSANTGTGMVSLGSVANSAQLTDDTYRVVFNVASGVTTYDIVNVTTAATVSAGNAYQSGASIQVAGMQFAIDGDPANGDTFSAAPSPTQSLFATIEQAAIALESTADDPAAIAQLATKIGAAIGNIDLGIEKALGVQAEFGSSLRELEMMAEGTDGRQAALRTELSGLVDLDYARAITEFTREQQALEAARATYARIMQKSLFDMI